MTRKLFSDLDDDPAQRHRPKTRQEFMTAARGLRDDQHLQPGDIAQILGLSTNAVRELLHQADTGAELFGANIPHRSTRGTTS